jgi:fructose/tagatose bisphosphate aldolase
MTQTHNIISRAGITDHVRVNRTHLRIANGSNKDIYKSRFSYVMCDQSREKIKQAVTGTRDYFDSATLAKQTH